MKKWIPCILILSLLPVFGCASQQPQEGNYEIYCLANLEETRGEDAVRAVDFYAEGETDQKIAETLLNAMCTIENVSCRSALPKGTELIDVQIKNGLAEVNLTEEYGALSGMDLTLADGCITLTLCQIDSVDRVRVLKEGKEMSYRGQEILSSSNLMLRQMDEGFRTLRVRLFYPEKETGELISERRTVQLPDGKSRIETVWEELREGPEDSKLESVIPEDVRVISSRIEEGVCYLTISKNFLEKVPDSLREQETVVYSLVKSLCSVNNIQAVQITVEGDSTCLYGQVDLSQPLS